MRLSRKINAGMVLAFLLALSACDTGDSGEQGEPQGAKPQSEAEERETIWDLFEGNDDPNTTIRVNKYLWYASLDVLSFLPIEFVDPFSGVIVTGYGKPSGGGEAYRATIRVRDPALEARSLAISLHTSSGPVAPETVTAIEDAILTRARELRLEDAKL